MAQKTKSASLSPGYNSCFRNEEEWIQWFDREEHKHYDVCADDHCQRYQGILRNYTSRVAEAVEKTRGEVLTFRGKICDTRFSKCCGGVTERFDLTWEPEVHPYLSMVEDLKPASGIPDLQKESEARKWILSAPPAFCHTTDRKILSNVLNRYDLETTDFFRWQVSYSTEELSALVRSKLGIDFGLIQALQPVERGVSGRLIRIRIIGSLKTMVIGKELLIRKAFSPSHLYSSAFVVDTEPGPEGFPLRFTFHGAGWGHGVGLCQIGAAVMSEQGYRYDEILAHYFPGARLNQLKEQSI